MRGKFDLDVVTCLGYGRARQNRRLYGRASPTATHDTASNDSPAAAGTPIFVAGKQAGWRGQAAGGAAALGVVEGPTLALDQRPAGSALGRSRAAPLRPAVHSGGRSGTEAREVDVIAILEQERVMRIKC